MRIFKKLFSLGITDHLSIEQAQLVRLTNGVGIVPLPVYLFYIGYGIYFHQWFSIFLASTMIVFSVVALFFQAHRHYTTAKVILFALNSFSPWLTYHVFNVDYSALTSYFPILFCLVLFFDLNTERRAFIFTFVYVVFCIVSSFYLPRHQIYSVQLPPELAASSNRFHLVWSFLITGLVMLLAYRNYLHTKHKLIEAKEAAERYGKMQTDFLANMSHEIRTPLNGVVGMSELLQSTQLSAEQEGYLKSIRSSSHHLLGLITDIIDVTRLEADTLLLRENPFSPMELLQDVVQMLRSKAQQKGISLEVAVADELPKYLLGDFPRIKQVITNLVGNAIKFTDAGSVKLVAGLAAHHGQMVRLRLEVVDTGIGIPPEQQPRLFDRFYQAEYSANRRYMGSGLGLAISKMLVERMGGTILVRSAVGKGTSFIVQIPLKVTQMAEQQPNKLMNEEQAILPSLQILVAEDNAINQLVIRKLLEQRGFSSELAEDGEAAVQEAREKPYELIFMDIQMPGMDGLEATRAIRQMNQSPRPLIVALTANAMAEVRDECLEAGMDDFLTKPISGEQLDDLLARHFGQR